MKNTIYEVNELYIFRTNIMDLEVSNFDKSFQLPIALEQYLNMAWHQDFLIIF